MSRSSSPTIVPPTAHEVLGVATEGVVRAGAELIDAGEVAKALASAGGRTAIDSTYDVGSAAFDAATELADVATRRIRGRYVLMFLALVAASAGALWWFRRSAPSRDEAPRSTPASATRPAVERIGA